VDAFLTRPALQTIEAAVRNSRRAVSGLLLGHKRGGRVIVERAVPSGSRDFPGREAYARLVSILEGEVVGFFSSSPSSDRRKKTPPPFSVGKIFLSVKDGKRGCLFRALAIDYTYRFVWHPLRIASPGGGRRV